MNFEESYKTIIEAINKELLEMVESVDKEKPYIYTENLTYFQEIRFRLEEFDYFGEEDPIIEGINERLQTGRPVEKVAKELINDIYTFAFSDITWENINDDIGCSLKE